ncbi:MAG: hypothetical protein ACI4VK_06485 [Candidatus Coproplasma sp.]
MEKFILGLAVGMAGGAVLVANNCKLRNLVKKNQEDIMKKCEAYIDNKLGESGGQQGSCCAEEE